MLSDYKEKITNLLNTQKSVIRHDLSDRFSELDKSLAFFKKVYGFEPIKENIYLALTSPRQINILLTGPPASAKSLFVQIIAENCNDVVYFDATNTTGAGLIEVLYNNQNAKILIIDEIDKLKKNDQNCLLGLLNNGQVDKALKNIHYKFSMNIKVFATCNSNSKLSKPIRSRFQEYALPVYSDEDFVKVSRFCLQDRDDISSETAELIAKVLLAHEKKDIRLVISIANLVKKRHTEEDVIRVIENFLQYAPTQLVDYN